jgi:hypothetical protein
VVGYGEYVALGVICSGGRYISLWLCLRCRSSRRVVMKVSLFFEEITKDGLVCTMTYLTLEGPNYWRVYLIRADSVAHVRIGRIDSLLYLGIET